MIQETFWCLSRARAKLRRGQEQLAPPFLSLRFCRVNVDAGRWVPGVPLVLSARGSGSFKSQTRGDHPIAQRKRQSQHAIAIRDIGAYCVDWEREGHFARVGSRVPLIEEPLLAIVLFEQSAECPLENQAPVIRYLDGNILRLQPWHGGCDHQATIRAVHVQGD